MPHNIVKRADYMGDERPVHGGVWYNLEDWSNRYANAVQVTDMSGDGIEGIVMLERITVVPNLRPLPELLDVVGLRVDELTKMTGDLWKLRVLDAAIAYGAYDSNQREIVVDDRDDYMASDRFHRKLIEEAYNVIFLDETGYNSLEDYIEGEYLDW